MTRNGHYDVIIIGTGAGGGTMLHALAPTGARILVIERGEAVPREDDNWNPVAVWKHLRYRTAETWLGALRRARENPDEATVAEPPMGPPPVARWHRRKPEAATRLQAARAELAELSEKVGVPAENLVSPALVRRLCWDWQETAGTGDGVAEVTEVLRAGGARPWQVDIVAPALAKALTAKPAT